MLDQEQIKARVVGQPAGAQGHEIVLRTNGEAVSDGNTGLRLLDGWASEGFAGQEGEQVP